MAAAVWQQALALDARYNAYRAPNNPQFSEFSYGLLVTKQNTLLARQNETFLCLRFEGAWSVKFVLSSPS